MPSSRTVMRAKPLPEWPVTMLPSGSAKVVLPAKLDPLVMVRPPAGVLLTWPEPPPPEPPPPFAPEPPPKKPPPPPPP